MRLRRDTCLCLHPVATTFTRSRGVPMFMSGTLVDALEALYHVGRAPGRSLPDWASDARAALGPVFSGAGDLALVGWRQEAPAPFFSLNLPHELTRPDAASAWGRALFRSVAPVAPFGPDRVALFTEPEPGMALAVIAPVAHTGRLTPPTTEALTRLGLHVECAARLHLRAAAPVVSVGLDGAGSPDKGVRLAAQALTRVRAVARRDDAGALLRWPLLIDGRLALVPGPDGYDLVPNEPRWWQSISALTPREQAILILTARGLSNKLVGHLLGSTAASVSKGLGSTSAKLGLTDSRTLVRLAREFRADGRSLASVGDLTPAEWSVADLYSRGMTHAEIARLRGSEEQTVANQLATIVRKIGGGNRPRRR